MPSTAAQSFSRPSLTSQERLNNLIVDAIQDIKGKAVVSIDLRRVEDSPASFFVICEGESQVQVRAIAENIRRRARTELGETARRAEGTDKANWVLLDFFDVVVHVFNRDARAFYDLEGLWGDAPITSYEEL